MTELSLQASRAESGLPGVAGAESGLELRTSLQCSLEFTLEQTVFFSSIRRSQLSTQFALYLVMQVKPRLACGWGDRSHSQED